MKIRETEEGYVVEFFPEAKVIGRVEREGERIEIGDLKGRLVVARVFYNKRYSLDEVIGYAKRQEERLRRLLG